EPSIRFGRTSSMAATSRDLQMSGCCKPASGRRSISVLARARVSMIPYRIPSARSQSGN
ncbi:hypothetical protein LTR94_023612, partial [Friedmanniomyces endolithicus]